MRESRISRGRLGPSRFRGIISVAVLLTPFVVSTCSTNPPPVPVRGADDDIALLEGRWAGSYESAETGRHGSILFQLDAAADTAYGDVLMLPPDRPLSYRVDDQGLVLREDSPDPPSILPIRFVAIEDGGVRGVLEAYTDPDCGCRLRTSFSGQLNGDAIEGRYSTEHLDTGRVRTGRWQVRRLVP